MRDRDGSNSGLDHDAFSRPVPAAAHSDQRVQSTLLGYTMSGCQMAATLLSRPDLIAKVPFWTRTQAPSRNLSIFGSH